MLTDTKHLTTVFAALASADLRRDVIQASSPEPHFHSGADADTDSGFAFSYAVTRRTRVLTEIGCARLLVKREP
jgi:hypothetical protein